MTGKNLKLSTLCLGFFLVLPVANLCRATVAAGVLIGAHLDYAHPPQPANQFLGYSSPQEGVKEDRLGGDPSTPTTSNSSPDTVRRYRDSQRILILGGPEALSM